MASDWIEAVKKFNKQPREVKVPNVWAMPRHFAPGTKEETYEYRLVKALQGGKSAGSVPKKLPTGKQPRITEVFENVKKRKAEEEAKKKAEEEAMKPKRGRKKKATA